jgi:hypothetical protein
MALLGYHSLPYRAYFYYDKHTSDKEEQQGRASTQEPTPFMGESLGIRCSEQGQNSGHCEL